MSLDYSLKCGLNKVAGSYYKYNHSDITNERNSLSVMHALLKKMTLGYLGKPYTLYVCPSPPANEIYMPTDQWKKCTFEDTNFITHIYAKADAKSCDAIAINSGKRSAIYQKNGKLYRLKGCGNYAQGFPTEKCFSMTENSIEVRGTQHLYTALREHYISTYISENIGLKIGNIPIGIWKYDKLPQNKGYADEADMIDKYCSIFETVGDKRGQTHLFQGMLAFMHIIAHYGIDFQRYETSPEFGFLKAIIDEKTKKGYYMTKDCFLTFPTKRLKSKEDIFTNDLFPLEVIKSMLRISQIDPNGIFQSLISKDMLMKNMEVIRQEYAIKDINKFKQYIDLLDGKYFSLFEQFIERASYEIAYNLRRMIEHDLNWGCYWDLNPQSIHCNSHPDNYVIIPRNQERIFAVLDFDLAFLKSNHINIDENSVNYGKADEEEFYSFTSRQIHEMDNMLLNALDLRPDSLLPLPPLAGPHKLMYEFWGGVMKEMCSYYYRKTISYPLKEMHSINDSQSVYNVIELCLLLTDSIIA